MGGADPVVDGCELKIDQLLPVVTTVQHVHQFKIIALALYRIVTLGCVQAEQPMKLTLALAVAVTIATAVLAAPSLGAVTERAVADVRLTTPVNLDVAAKQAEAAAAVVRTARLGGLTSNYTWSGCINIPAIGPVCVVLTANPSPLSLEIDITVDGEVVLSETVSGNQVCVNTNDLLDVLEAVCAVCIPVIDAIKAALKYIPASVLSLCVDFENLDFTSSSVSGDVYLDATILCWESHCVYKGNNFLGHFNLPI
ncbi:uncharacterized protein AMSG_05954 [Thecamonas trahens ATCC 50062]|uniref:Uncharacterized protein n=1 Tax=Thecamonas trahens ATCC 50062 TaxID=461836 RepID=A0A0L0DC81_THETB|nr:hypothetical protein AMSG_05954 [Thecamonas trahens ATCC 50062]KNC49691.1 hypothetical protein AMSG_05954 [Thecamonas trahens ATCC 50062]|eukprot:XP_013757486.1 hypothetical protein AMSG_05954 [Thecamonas trahens ATCC 50062]